MLQDDVLDRQALLRAFAVGTLFQIVVVIFGHFVGILDDYIIGFLFAGMMISATVGYLYAQDVGRGYRRGALGGALAGGLCALIGIAVSVVLGDMPIAIWMQRFLISVLTGAVGGLFGELAYQFNALR